MAAFDIYIGIDVGYSGGISVLNEHMEIIEVFKTPITIQDFIDKLHNYHGLRVMGVIEYAKSQPKDGSASSWAFGYIIGITHCAMTAAKIPYDIVHPRTWQKEYRMAKEKGETDTDWKNRLKGKAQNLFPDHKCTLWNADALLISEYCRRKYR